MGRRRQEELVASIECSFLPGASLWQPGTFEVTEVCARDFAGTANPSRCTEFLASSERSREPWWLEAEFTTFETLSWGY